MELGGLAGHSQQLIEEIHFGQKRTGEDGLTDHKILILIWKSLERQCWVNYGYHRKNEVIHCRYEIATGLNNVTNHPHHGSLGSLGSLVVHISCRKINCS